MKYRVNSGKAVQHARRTTRRVEAQARQVFSAGLTVVEKLERLDLGGYTAVRERARLVKQGR